MSSYEEIFNKRGKSYHFAMEKYPRARDNEFISLVHRLHLAPESVLLDIPAGGGYLLKYLPNVSYLAYDFSGEFEDGHQGIKKCKESNIQLEDNSVDVVVSLAALHHVSDREGFYSEMYRVLKAGGQMIIADVDVESPIASFLNGFVNDWNSMGHIGQFIDERDLLQIENAGFQVRKEVVEYTWDFKHADTAKDFFILLFGLDKNPPMADLESALELLGVERSSGYKVNWGLTYLIGSK